MLPHRRPQAGNSQKGVRGLPAFSVSCTDCCISQQTGKCLHCVSSLHAGSVRHTKAKNFIWGRHSASSIFRVFPQMAIYPPMLLQVMILIRWQGRQFSAGKISDDKCWQTSGTTPMGGTFYQTRVENAIAAGCQPVRR